MAGAVAAAMKEGQAGLGRFAMHLDGDAVVLSIVGGGRELVPDDVLIVNQIGRASCRERV